MKAAVLIAALVFSALAQTGAVSGPVMGMLAGGGRFRPILGVPGAAIVDRALPAEVDFSEAAVSPRQDYALVVTEPEGRVVRVPFGGQPATVEGASARPSRMLMSPRGEAAALYFAGAGALEIVSAAAVVRVHDLSGLPAAPVLAIGDNGTAVALAAGSLFLFGAGAARPVAAVGEASVLSFDGADAVLARPGQVTLVRDVAGAAEIRVLPGGEALVRPVAIAMDNGRVLVADGENATITVIESSGGVATVACGCTVAVLERLNGKALFRITPPEQRPVWLLDTGNPDPQLWFVPDSEEVRQ